MSRPRGQHLEPLRGLPRHYPHCTAAYRAEEGCWCSVSYYAGEKPPRARDYRRLRRVSARSWHRWGLIEKRHGIPPQHNHALHYVSPRGYRHVIDPNCPDGCPRKGFDYARDWPPTVTSWKGLTR